MLKNYIKKTRAMKQYIFSILFVLGVSASYSQSRELVLKEQFETNANTVLNIDVDNVTIEFKESSDNKIHFDYFIAFKKDAEEVIYKVFKDISANVSKKGNTVHLNVKNSMFLGEYYTVDVGFDKFKEVMIEYYKKHRGNEAPYRSKETVLNDIDFSVGMGFQDYVKKIKENYPNRDLGKGSRKFKQQFVIEVPKHIKVKIKALHSRITFDYNVEIPIEVSTFKTYLKFKEINHTGSTFKLTKGILLSRNINGGVYKLMDVSKTVIGTISNAKVTAETSKIQVGEVGSNVMFDDFNSKLYLYNIGKNFSALNVKGDYSELNLYKVKKGNYSMNVFGSNTVMNMDNVKTTFGSPKDKKMTKILNKKAKNNGSNGNIEVELKNGIVNIIPDAK